MKQRYRCKKPNGLKSVLRVRFRDSNHISFLFCKSLRGGGGGRGWGCDGCDLDHVVQSKKKKDFFPFFLKCNVVCRL